jgi:hypothetical protein
LPGGEAVAGHQLGGRFHGHTPAVAAKPIANGLTLRPAFVASMKNV